MEPFPLQLPAHRCRPDTQEKIRKAPGFSAPRTIFRHPVMAVRHLIDSLKEKKRLETR